MSAMTKKKSNMNIDEKLNDILSWLNEHGLKKEAAELDSLIKSSDDLSSSDSREENREESRSPSTDK